MKNIIKLTTLSLSLLFAAFAASAQTPYSTTGNTSGNAGSTSLSITVAKSVDLRGAASQPINQVNGATYTGLVDNDALNVQLNFTDTTPVNTQVSNTSNEAKLMYASIPFKVRSNAAFEVYATLESGGTLPDGAGNSGEFKTGDVGFGIINSLPSGGAPPGTLLVAGTMSLANWNLNVASVNTTNGQPSYPKTLNSIGYGDPKKVASGGRVSQRGDNTTNNNFRHASLVFAVKPQYYAPTAAPLTATFKIYAITP